jgi:hypothetical protein
MLRCTTITRRKRTLIRRVLRGDALRGRWESGGSVGELPSMDAQNYGVSHRKYGTHNKVQNSTRCTPMSCALDRQQPCSKTRNSPSFTRVCKFTLCRHRAKLAGAAHTSSGSPSTCTSVSIETLSARTLLRRQPRVMPSIRAAFDWLPSQTRSTRVTT